jgi:hypothetical protein
MKVRDHRTLTGETGAVFSDCERYRYKLWRRWLDAGETLNFLMLNPSTADELVDDPTVSRCQKRAESMGYGCLVVTNLFAFRATNPKDMKSEPDPIGEHNDAFISDAASNAQCVVCAWGQHGKYRGRAREVLAMLKKNWPSKVHTLKTSVDGTPHHPLYLSYDLKPIPMFGEPPCPSASQSPCGPLSAEESRGP